MTDRRFRPAAARETGDDDPDVRELMTHRLVGIAHNADADVALRLLGSAAVRHLAVMDGSCCLGLVFEHDVLTYFARQPLHPGMHLTVGQLCRQVPQVSESDRRSTLARLMTSHGVDAVAVTRDEQLIGLVTAVDVVRSLTAHRPAPLDAAT